MAGLLFLLFEVRTWKWLDLSMDNGLRQSAQRLLDSTNITKILSQFGEVYIIGSFAFDLMTEPDIDLVVITDKPKIMSEEALSTVSKMHLFQKLEYGDFEKFPKENRPPFYILNMKTPFDGQAFEIETWFLPEIDKQLEFVEMMKNITEEQKQEIIRLKLNRRSKHKLSSFEIYKQVLRA